MASSSQSAPLAPVSRETLLQSRGIQLKGPDSLQDLNYLPLQYRLQWERLQEWGRVEFVDMFSAWWDNLAKDELDAVDATFQNYMEQHQTWYELPQPFEMRSKEEFVTALRSLYIEPHNLAVQSKAMANAVGTVAGPAADPANTGTAVQKQENKAKTFAKNIFKPSSKSQGKAPLTVGTANTSGTGTQSVTMAPLTPSEHSTIESPAHLTTPMIGDADLVFEHEGLARGGIVVKVSAQINEKAIDDIFDRGIIDLFHGANLLLGTGHVTALVALE